MDIKHFRLIKSITEEGNIANSSDKLFLTQSALSHQLKELENRLGFKVFIRTRNKWELTQQGQELYKLSNELLDKIDTSLSQIDSINAGSVGKVRIGTECYTFYQGLPAFIQKMGVLFPDIEVDIIQNATYTPIPKLVSNEIDMAITTERPTSEKLKSIELFRDEVVCVMHKENEFHSKDHLDFSSFADLHLFIHSYPLESVFVYSKYLKPNGITPKKITAIPFLSLVFEMISANMGVTTLPKHLLASFNLSNEIILKKIGPDGLKRTQYLVFRAEDESKQYISDFISNIQEEYLD